MSPSTHNFMLGMKRSFVCTDLHSIGTADDLSSSVAAVVDGRDEYQPSKRRRADSTASSCSAVCCCCCWEGDRTSCTESFSSFLPSSMMEESSSTATPGLVNHSHAIVTPVMAPITMPSSEEVCMAPNFPSLKGLKESRSRSSSSSSGDECPATAALERFMLPQKGDSTLIDSSSSECGFDHFSFDDEPCADLPEEERAFSPSPRRFDSVIPSPPWQHDDGRRKPRTVSFSSRKSSLASVDSSSSSRTIDSVSADHSSLLSMLSSCTLQPNKKELSKRTIPTVNEADTML